MFDRMARWRRIRAAAVRAGRVSLTAADFAIAADRPGYGSSRLPAGGFAANARRARRPGRARHHPLEHAISSVQAPVLLLADPRDTLVPVDTARRLARALPDARLELVQGAGHHLPRRAPDAVADAMVAFLAATEEVDNRVERRSLTVGRRASR